MPDPQFNGDGGGDDHRAAAGRRHRDDRPSSTTPRRRASRILDKVQAERAAADPRKIEEEKQKALAFAQCMRDHGVDMPDPTFDADGGGSGADRRARHRPRLARLPGGQRRRARSRRGRCSVAPRSRSGNAPPARLEQRGPTRSDTWSAGVPAPARSRRRRWPASAAWRRRLLGGGSAGPGGGRHRGRRLDRTPADRSTRRPRSPSGTSSRPSMSTARSATAMPARSLAAPTARDRPPGRHRRRRGGTLCEVDGAPGAALLFGDRPDVAAASRASTRATTSTSSRRTSSPSATAPDGPDRRRHVERAATTSAVKRWQKALGVDQTGRGRPRPTSSSCPGPVRIAESKAAVGDEGGAQTQVLDVTAPSRSSTVDLDASKPAVVKRTTRSTIELPDGTHDPGTVALGRHRRHTEHRQGRRRNDLDVVVALARRSGRRPRRGPGHVNFTSHGRRRAGRAGERAAGPGRGRLRRREVTCAGDRLVAVRARRLRRRLGRGRPATCARATRWCRHERDPCRTRPPVVALDDLRRADDVVKEYPGPRRCGPSTASTCTVEHGRAGGHRRPVGVGQVDAAQRDGRPRPADGRQRPHRRPRRRPAARRRRCPRCGPRTSASCSSSSTCSTASTALDNVGRRAPLPRGRAGRAPGAGPRGARAGRARPPARPPAGAAVGRRAPTGRHRPGLVGEPALVLADEPTGNLDCRTGAEIIDLLPELHQTARPSCVITHDRDDRRALPRCVSLRDGRIAATDRRAA